MIYKCPSIMLCKLGFVSEHMEIKSNDKIRIHKYFLMWIIPECEILCDKVHEIFTQAYDFMYI